MWFTWIGAFFVSGVQFLLSKFTLSKAGLVIVIPMYIIYIGAIFISWGLLLAVIVQVVNSAFDVINMVNTQSGGAGGGSSSVFKCFFYLLNALGVADSLKTGISLLVSDLLVVMVIKGSSAFKSTTKEMILITNGMFGRSVV